MVDIDAHRIRGYLVKDVLPATSASGPNADKF